MPSPPTPSPRYQMVMTNHKKQRYDTSNVKYPYHKWQNINMAVKESNTKPWSHKASVHRAVCLWPVCGRNRGHRSIALRVPQGVGLNRRGREIQNQWSWTVERFANMFANQSTVHDLNSYGHLLTERLTHGAPTDH